MWLVCFPNRSWQTLTNTPQLLHNSSELCCRQLRILEIVKTLRIDLQFLRTLKDDALKDEFIKEDEVVILAREELRSKLFDMVKSRRFSIAIFVLIGLNCVTMLMDDPLCEPKKARGGEAAVLPWEAEVFETRLGLCDCINASTVLQKSSQFDAKLDELVCEGDCTLALHKRLNLRNVSGQYKYNPHNYGSLACKPHDKNLGPCHLNVSETSCSTSWCYTDSSCPQGQPSIMWDSELSYVVCDGAESEWTLVDQYECSQTLPIVLMYTEFTLLTLFTFELAVKSFVLRTLYLKSPWNLIDMMCVLSGWLVVLPGVPNLTLLRIFRVLRPLRTINRVENVRNLVQAFVGSAGPLLQVALLLLLMLFVYAIIGLVLFMGSLHGRCFYTPTMAHESEARLCGVDSKGQATESGNTCVALNSSLQAFCSAADPVSGKTNPNPTWEGNSDRLLSFDNLGAAMVVLFQTLTLDGWSSILYVMQEGNDKIIVRAYLVLFIFIGTMYSHKRTHARKHMRMSVHRCVTHGAHAHTACACALRRERPAVP